MTFLTLKVFILFLTLKVVKLFDVEHLLIIVYQDKME